MTSFYLRIVTPNGEAFSGMAEKILLRTIHGDVCLLAKHIDYITALGMGECRVTVAGGEVRKAACIGGMVMVSDEMVHVIASTFEWADEIDVERAKASIARAEAMLAAPDKDEHTVQYANARIKRARVRLSAAEKK